MRERWEAKALGEICQIKPPKKEAKERLSPDDLVSFVPMRDLRERRKDLELNEEKPLAKVVSSYTYFADNDVLLAKITPCFENGKLGIARNLKNGIGFGSSEYIVFRSKGQIEPDYLFYFLSQDSFRDAGARVMTGAVGHKRVSKEFIETLQIPLPPLDEQKRIVALLDEAFAGIAVALAAASKNLKNARELFETTLNATFTQKGEGWVETTLGEVCERVEYGTSSKSQKTGSVPVLRMGNIQNRELDWGKLVYTDNKEDINKLKLRNGDVLFNRTNSPELVGKSAIFRSKQQAIFAGYLIRVHPSTSRINAEFLNFYLNSSATRDYGKTVMSGSVNQANINGSKLKLYPITLPNDLEAQVEIVKMLNSLSTQTQYLETLYQQKIDALNELKQSLLQRAFAGELTDTDVVQAVEVMDTRSSEFAANVIAVAFRQHEIGRKGKTYGRVKAQKGLHLVESIGGIDLGRDPIKDAAGPNDSAHARLAEDRAKANQFFEFVRRPDGLGYDFVKLPKYDALLSRAENNLAEYADDIGNAIKPLVQKRTEAAEVFTTVHAAWNNLIIDGADINDEAIVTEAREDWHPDKMKISRNKFFDAIRDIRLRGLEPDGTGKQVGVKQERLI